MKALAALFAIALPLLGVDGVVVNATSGKPQSGVAINLVQPSQNGMVQLGNATTDAQGQFKIDKQIPPVSLARPSQSRFRKAVQTTTHRTWFAIRTEIPTSSSKGTGIRVRQNVGTPTARVEAGNPLRSRFKVF